MHAQWLLLRLLLLMLLMLRLRLRRPLLLMLLMSLLLLPRLLMLWGWQLPLVLLLPQLPADWSGCGGGGRRTAQLCRRTPVRCRVCGRAVCGHSAGGYCWRGVAPCCGVIQIEIPLVHWRALPWATLWHKQYRLSCEDDESMEKQRLLSYFAVP